MKKVLVLYIPVIHAGYLNLLERYRGKVDALFILGEDFVAEFLRVKKEIRDLSPVMVWPIIVNFSFFSRVEVLTATNLHLLKNAEIVTAQDEICRGFVAKYLPDARVTYDTTFLRWNAENIQSSTKVRHGRVSEDAFDRQMMAEAQQEADKSSDSWRHVGAVVVRDGEIIARGHNHHLPDEHAPYKNGDPRDSIDPGTLNLAYTSLHAEQAIVTEAAREGFSLKGGHMYITIFPCPFCAKMMSEAGITKCFFREGSAWLDAEQVLEAHGVEIVLVQ